MAEERITVVGFDELAEGSEDLFGKIDEAAESRFEQVAAGVAGSVAATVPRVTGALAAAYGVTVEEGRVEVGLDKADVPYAGWIEFGGTRGRPYAPEGRYLYPAALAIDQELQAAGEDVVEQEIGRQQWQSPRT